MNIYIVYSCYSTGQRVLAKTMECRLIGDLPVSSHHLLSYLKGRPWDQLPLEVQKRGDKEMIIARRKPTGLEWAMPINELEWRYIQKCWNNQSPGLVLINSQDQLRQEVVEITGDHTDDDGVDFGVTINFAVDIKGVSPDEFDVDRIYNDTRRHFLLAKACLRQINILNGQIPPEVADDFADLEITLDEFFMAPAVAQKDTPKTFRPALAGRVVTIRQE